MNLRENWSRTKEMMMALWRQGQHEIGNILYGPGTAAAAPEYGMPGTRLPSEVAAGMRGGQEHAPSQTPARHDAAPQGLDHHHQEPHTTHERSRDERHREGPELTR